jgi:hypothetical protein
MICQKRDVMKSLNERNVLTEILMLRREEACPSEELVKGMSPALTRSKRFHERPFRTVLDTRLITMNCGNNNLEHGTSKPTGSALRRFREDAGSGTECAVRESCYMQDS